MTGHTLPTDRLAYKNNQINTNTNQKLITAIPNPFGLVGACFRLLISVAKLNSNGAGIRA